MFGHGPKLPRLEWLKMDGFLTQKRKEDIGKKSLSSPLFSYIIEYIEHIDNIEVWKYLCFSRLQRFFRKLTALFRKLTALLKGVVYSSFLARFLTVLLVLFWVPFLTYFIGLVLSASGVQKSGLFFRM